MVNKEQVKEQVSSLQIAFMIMLFEIGSTPLFLLGAPPSRIPGWRCVQVQRRASPFSLC